MAQIASKLANDPSADIIDALTQSVAELSVGMMKAQNYHWNVKGMAAGPLHALFQDIYEDHFTAIDDLAERVKALGGHAVGRYSAYLNRAKITECDGHETAETMIANLAADQEVMSATLLSLARLAEEHGDDVTNDMAIGRAQAHDKFAWLLRMHLG